MKDFRSRRATAWELLLWALLCILASRMAAASESAMLQAPARLSVGGRASISVLALDPSTGKPTARPVSLVLVGLDGEVAALAAGTTSDQGPVRFDFEVPVVAAGGYRIRAQVGGETLETETVVTSTPALLIETDKPVYRPGQTLQGRIVRLDSRLQPAAGSVEVTFYDGKGIRIGRENLEAGEFGVAPFSLELASEVNQGQWRIRARSEGVESVRDVRVENYVLPRFEANVEFEKSWALPGDEVAGRVSANYFFGKPVDGVVRLTASRWVGFWEPYDQFEGDLLLGVFDFRIKPVEYVTGTPQQGGQSSIRVDVEVIDSAGNAQSIVDSLLISPAPVTLKLTAADNTLRPGLDMPIVVTASTPDGRPVFARAEITADFETFDQELLSQRETADVDGVLVWTLRAPAGTLAAEIKATAQTGGQAIETSIRLAGSYSPGGAFLSLSRVDGDGAAALGQTLAYRVAATRPGTIYYEVYAAGGTVFSDYTESGEFSFPVTTDMIPSGRVLAYQITPENEVAADSARFETVLPIEATVQTSFDAGQAGPGDPVTVTLDTGLKRRAMLGVSIVDESVLALGRSRLHLEEVFEELEKRFLEPQAEVEEGADPGGPIGPGLGIPFFAPVRVAGSKSVFDSLGIRVATTPDLLVATGFEFAFADVPINLSPPPDSSGQPMAAEAPRLRQFFPETWLWNPALVTDEQGRATFKLTAPDSITGWRLAAVATQANPDGPGISFGEAELTVFQDFFVEPTLPEAVVRGETFPLKIDVFNYSNAAQSIRLKVDQASGVELISGSDQTISVPPNGATSVRVPLRAGKAGDFPLRVTAFGSTRSDAVLRTLHVVPEGFANEAVYNGVIRAGEDAELPILVPDNAVEDSAGMFLSLTPSPVGQTLQGVSDLLAMPYGCGEQNMIFLAPDIEVLKYLREIGELNPEVRATAESFVNTGYQRQLTFQTGDGGFAAFGGENGSLWLTAFVLSSFSGAREIRDIDESVLAKAAAMILARQREDGTFEEDDFLIHTELLGGAGRAFSSVAYVANALADYGGSEVAGALTHAAAYLQAGYSNPSSYSDPYGLALAAVALQKVDGFEATAEAILDRLLQLAITDQDGLHWEPYPVETTGYALLGLLQSRGGAGRIETVAVLDWLSTRRNLHGGYGSSTQDTVVALKALFSAARQVNRSIDLRVDVIGRHEKVATLHLNPGNFDLLQQVALPIEEAPFRLEANGSGRSSYQLATRYNLPFDHIPPGRDLSLDVAYSADHVDVDDIVDVTVSLAYTGGKERTGMVIVDIGIPTGFESVAPSLDALIAAGTVERIEHAGRKRIFYIDHVGPGEPLSFAFQIRALFPIRAEGVLSQAYDYYDGTTRAFDVKDEVEVIGAPRTPRIESVSVDSAPGGSRITVIGEGFLEGAVEVLFNGVAGADLEVLGDGTLQVTVPNLLPGPVQVEVVTAAGRASWSGGEAGGFVVSPYRLFFPLYSPLSAQPSFNGYAFANYSDRTAHLQVRAFPSISSSNNAVVAAPGLTLQPGEQRALLERQLLGDDSEGLAWIEVESDNSQLAGTFQFGGPRSLDGCAPVQTASRRFWFTRVHDGPGAFSGVASSTRITLANPGDETARVRLTLNDINGRVVRIRELGPRLSFTETIGAIFGPRGSISKGFVEVEVLEGPGLIGFERLDLIGPETSIGLTASVGNPSDQSWSAQLAFSRDRLTTSVNLVNTSATIRHVELVAVRENGSVVASRAVALSPGGQFQEDVTRVFGSIFSNLDEPTPNFTGSLRVQADGPGVIGDVAFHDPDGGKAAAALALQTSAFREAVFGHFADTSSFFTGIALYNPGSEAVEVSVFVHAQDGSVVGSAQLVLQPGTRLSKEVTELAPAAGGRLGGYLRLESTHPVVAQEIFGDRSLESLSAVPPVVVR